MAVANTTSRTLQISIRAVDQISKPIRAVVTALRAVTSVGVGAFNLLMAPIRMVGRLISGLLSPIGLVRTALALLAGRGIMRFVTGVAELGDQFHKMSQRTRVSAEELSRLSHAAQLSGTDINQLGNVLFRMQRRVANAITGTGPAVRALEELGFAAEDLAALSPEEMFITLADAINGVDNEARGAQLAFEVFGDEAKAIMPLVRAGGDAIRKMGDDAERLGIVMTDFEATTSAEFTDAMTRVKAAFQGVRQTLILELMPALTESFNSITDFVADNRETIKRWADVTAGAFTMVTGTVRAFGQMIVSTLSSGNAEQIQSLVSFFGLMGRLAVDAFITAIRGGVQTIAAIIRELGPPLIQGIGQIGLQAGSAMMSAIRESIFGSERSKLTEQMVQLEAAIINRVRKFRPQFQGELADLTGDMLSGLPPRTQRDIGMMMLQLDELQKGIRAIEREGKQASTRLSNTIADSINESIAGVDRLKTELSPIAKDLIDEATAAWDTFVAGVDALDGESIMAFRAELARLKAEFDAVISGAARGASAASANGGLLASIGAGAASAGGGFLDSIARVLPELQEKTGTFWDGFKEEAKRAKDFLLNEAKQGVSAFNQVFGTVNRHVDSIIDRAVDGTLKIKDAVRDMARSILSDFAKIAARRVAAGVVGSFFGSAKGNLFGNSAGVGGVGGANVIPFASGGIVGSLSDMIGRVTNGPTFFPMAAGAVGVMGEAGAETAIAPLGRDPRTGELGVKIVGGGDGGGAGGSVVVNVTQHFSAVDARGLEQLAQSREFRNATEQTVLSAIERKRNMRAAIRGVR